MRKLITVLCLILLSTIISCEKKICKQCIAKTTNSTNSITTYQPAYEMCGDSLQGLDGQTSTILVSDIMYTTVIHCK